MKKTLFSFILALLLLNLMMAGLGQSSYAEERVSFENKNVKNAGGIKVFVQGGFPLEFDTPIKISEGRTLVPLRKIAEAFHYDVQYDEKTKTVTLNRDTSFIRMVLGDNSVFASSSWDLEDGYFIMERQPEVYEGRTYVPLRAIGELFRCNVLWDAKTKSIHINGVIGAGGDVELVAEEGEVPFYRYNGQIFEGRPSGNGFLKFGLGMGSYYRGEFLKGAPNGNGLMRYFTDPETYNIMGRFEDGKLVEGSVLNGVNFSFIKDGKVDATYTVRDGDYIKIANEPELNEALFKAIQTEVSVFN